MRKLAMFLLAMGLLSVSAAGAFAQDAETYALPSSSTEAPLPPAVDGRAAEQGLSSAAHKAKAHKAVKKAHKAGKKAHVKAKAHKVKHHKKG